MYVCILYFNGFDISGLGLLYVWEHVDNLHVVCLKNSSCSVHTQPSSAAICWLTSTRAMLLSTFPSLN